MANQYTKMTKENILRKIYRKRNPVQTVTQLANEFGVNTAYVRQYDYWYGHEGETVNAPSASFRNRVRNMIGDREYRRLAARKKIVR